MKYFVTNGNFVVLDELKTKKMNIFYQQSEAILDDSPFKIFKLEKEVKFFEQHDRELYEESVNPQKLLSIYLRSYSVKKVYTRSVGSMIEYLGDIGGMF